MKIEISFFEGNTNEHIHLVSSSCDRKQSMQSFETVLLKKQMWSLAAKHKTNQLTEQFTIIKSKVKLQSN